MSALDPDSRIRIPLFPLSEVVLFPSARLPLHIFEPRYREMTEDALAGDGMIGMVLLRPDAAAADEAASDEPPAIYEVGCAGFIEQSRRLPDGRFLIELEGRFRFRILHEVASPKPYRIALAAPLAEEPSLAPGGPAASALDTAYAELETHILELMRLSAPKSEPILRERLSQLSSLELINALAAGIECTPPERQELLEATTAQDRCQRLSALIRFRIAELQFPSSTRTVN